MDRLCVPFILAKASRIDPSLFSIAHGLDDFTIPVVARHWANSTVPKKDIMYTSALLDELCSGPQHPVIKTHVERHPHSTSEAFLHRFLLGVSPAPNASGQEKCNALVDILKRQLPLIDDVDAQIKQLRLLADLVKIDKQTGLRKALLRRSEFWIATFDALSGAARKNARPLGLLLRTILYLSSLVVLSTLQEPVSDSAERDAIVEAFVEGGFFSALDACVSPRPNARGLVSIADNEGMEEPFAIIWHAFNRSAEQNPRIRVRLVSELPRARTLAALMHRFFTWNSRDEQQARYSDSPARVSYVPGDIVCAIGVAAPNQLPILALSVALWRTARVRANRLTGLNTDYCARRTG
ncbi:unnamed protein product [Peniophora sp. CBMAI 1063]|nr:unnamed protein product [Peniophora sp. CBMAI 1063]